MTSDSYVRHPACSGRVPIGIRLGFRVDKYEDSDVVETPRDRRRRIMFLYVDYLVFAAISAFIVWQVKLGTLALG